MNDMAKPLSDAQVEELLLAILAFEEEAQEKGFSEFDIASIFHFRASRIFGCLGYRGKVGTISAKLLGMAQGAAFGEATVLAGIPADMEEKIKIEIFLKVNYLSCKALAPLLCEAG